MYFPEGNFNKIKKLPIAPNSNPDRRFILGRDEEKLKGKATLLRDLTGFEEGSKLTVHFNKSISIPVSHAQNISGIHVSISVFKPALAAWSDFSVQINDEHSRNGTAIAVFCKESTVSYHYPNGTPIESRQAKKQAPPIAIK